MKSKKFWKVSITLMLFMGMYWCNVLAANDVTEPVVVTAGNNAEVGNVTVVNRGKAVEVHGSDGQPASAKVNGNVELTNEDRDPTAIGVIARADTKGSASVDVSGNVLVAAPDSAVGISSAAEKKSDYAEVNVVGDVTTLSPGDTARGIDVQDGNVTVGGNVSASGNKYAVGVATNSENQPSRIIIKGGLSALSPEGVAQGINTQDGNVTVGGNVSANGNNYAMGVAATSQNYPSSIIIKGGLSAEGIAVQAATISASDETGDLTFVVGKGGITAVSKGDIGGVADADAPSIMPMSTGLMVSDESGKLRADIQGDIKTQSDMKRSTALWIGGWHSENHGDNPAGTQDVRVHGNLISDDRGIFFIESDFATPSVTKVLVENEIKADNVGILVYKHHAELLLPKDNEHHVDPTQKLNLTVWKIKRNENGNVAEYFTEILPEGHVGPVPSEFADVSPTGVERDFEKKIMYIIKVEQPKHGGKLVALNANGKALAKSFGFDVAHEGEKVLLRANLTKGYKILAAYNGLGEKMPLLKDKNRNYYITVPKGGGVYLSVELKFDPTDSDNPIDNTDSKENSEGGTKNKKLNFSGNDNYEPSLLNSKAVQTGEGNTVAPWLLLSFISVGSFVGLEFCNKKRESGCKKF